MKELVFNHDVRRVHEALGVDNERREYIHGVILYQMAYQHIMVNQLFDDKDNAPANLRTKTGVLERIFDNVNTEEERIVATWDYCAADTRISEDDPRGMLFFHMLITRVKDFDLDQDKFCNWWVKNRQELEADTD